MESLGTQNHKNPETRTLEKKTLRETAKSGSMDTLGGVRELTFLIKSEAHPRKRSHRPPGLQNHRSGLKNKRPDLKNDEKLYSKMLARALAMIAHSSLR